MTETTAAIDAKDPFLVVLGERVRTMRSRRGVTRRKLERTRGTGTKIRPAWKPVPQRRCCCELGQALNCSMAELVGRMAWSRRNWC